MRRKPTPEQIEKAKQRRAAFREIVKVVAAMTEAQRQEIVGRIGAVPTCEGRALSPFNSCLILHQNPETSLVGGFQQWRKVGRAVRKGEHGMMIWFPSDKKKTDEPTGNEEDETKFLMGTVFDISQTDEIQ